MGELGNHRHVKGRTKTEYGKCGKETVKVGMKNECLISRRNTVEPVFL